MKTTKVLKWPRECYDEPEAAESKYSNGNLGDGDGCNLAESSPLFAQAKAMRSGQF